MAPQVIIVGADLADSASQGALTKAVAGQQGFLRRKGYSSRTRF
jgi:hypothetical protein